MAESQRRTAVRRLAGEFSIVFVGVALALAADDFRETRAERREAEESLALVLSDLMADSSDYVSVRESAESHTAAAAWLVERWGNPEVPPDSIERALQAFGSRATLQLSSSAFEGLRSSNRLRLIRNDSLKSATLQYFQVYQVTIWDFYQDYSRRREALVFDGLPRHVRFLGGQQEDGMWPPREGGLELRSSWAELSSDPFVHSEIVWLGRFSDFLGQIMLTGEAGAGHLMALIRAEIDS